MLSKINGIKTDLHFRDGLLILSQEVWIKNPSVVASWQLHVQSLKSKV